MSPEARGREREWTLARVLTVGRKRLELVVLAAILVATLLLPGGVPAGIYALGATAGGTLALHALGIVLVYRSNRIINFAQVALGSAAGVLFVELLTRRSLLVALHTVCEPCLPTREGAAIVGPAGVAVTELSRSEVAALQATGWLVTANYWVSLVLAVAAAGLLTWLIYVLVIRRFANAPRLVLTLVTIGLAQFLTGVRGSIPSLFGDEGSISGRAPAPIQFEWTVGRAVIESADVLKLVAAAVAIAALAVFFRRTASGVTLRGAADNPQRAETLGVPVARVTARVWVIAGLFSAVAALIEAMSVGVSTAGGGGNLLRPLAAAVFAGLSSLPVTAIAAVVLAVLDQSILWTLDSALLTEGVLLVVVIAVLLVQHAQRGRVDTEEQTWTAAREIRPTPVELRGLPSVQRWRRTAIGAVVTLGLALPWLLSPSQTTLTTAAMTYAMVGLSLLVLTGWAGQISLGQFGFAAVGAYVAAVTSLPFPFSVVAGGLAGAAVAAVIGVPALRLRGLHLAITTLAVAVAVPAILLNPRYLAKALPSRFERPAFLGLDLADTRTFYYVVLALLVAAVVAVLGMRNSRTARALIASRDNEAAAQAFGINLVSARLGAFAVSGFMAAAAGVLFAYTESAVQAGSYGPERSLELFAMVVIGGLGSVAGPLIGAAFLGTLDLFSAAPIVGLLLTGSGMVGLLLFLPGGLGQAAFGVRDAVLRRVADRNRILVPSLVADRLTATVDGRAPIAAKQRPGGGTAFVPARYQLDEQWLADPRESEAAHG